MRKLFLFINAILICYTANSQCNYKLPFSNGASFRCSQGNNGSYSHDGQAQYAFDFAMSINTNVCASRSGTVSHVTESYADYNNPSNCNYVNRIVVDHGDGTSALYLHLTQNGALVSVGNYVTQGQIIAKSGQTGCATGAHLHFMVMNADTYGSWYNQSIPISFCDVTSNGGVPESGNTYTSTSCVFGPPVTSIPSNVQTNVSIPVSFNWNDISGASPQYRIQVSTSNTGWTATDGFTSSTSESSTIRVNQNTSDISSYSWTSSMPYPPQSNKIYYWTVKTYVCGASSDYSAVKSFTTTNTTTNYTISTSSNPTAGGSTSGGGTVISGSSKTVTATANTGYTFTNWTENGSQVSTSASYTFTVSGNRTLVANFTLQDGTCRTCPSYDLSILPSTSWQTQSSTIGRNGCMIFKIPIPSTPGYTYTFKTGCGDGATANFDTKLELYDSNCNLLTNNDDACSTLQSSITWTSNYTTATFIYVRVSGLSSTFGNFTLAFLRLDPVANYAISTSSYPAAGGNTSGGGTVSSGSSKTVTATANTGYTFTNWTENGTVVSTSASYTFTVTANRTLVANFTAINYTIATSSSPTAGGTTSGAGTVQYGSSKTLTATANTGYNFTNWTESGTVVSTNASYTFTVSGNRTLVANFTLQDGTCRTCPSYDLSIQPSTSWQTQSSTIGRNGCIIFRIPVPSTPGFTYTFKTGCGDGATANFDTYLELYDSNCNLLTSSDNACSTLQSSITWISNYTAAAFIYVKVRGLSSTFGDFTLAFLRLDPVANYTISTSSNPAAGGNTSGGGTVTSGSSKTLTASANTGYTFTNWAESGTVVSTSASYTFTVTANRTLVANFTAINYTIATSSSPTAGGITSGAGTVQYGSSKTVTATANTGYAFNNWTENGTVVSNSASYTFSVNVNRTLVANFILSNVNYTINIISNPTAGGTTTGSGTYSSGSSRTVTATPNTGYTFTNWTESGNVVSTSASYTFNVTANRTLFANFTANNYTITTSSNPTAGGSTSGGGTYQSGTSKTITATPNSGYMFTNWTESGNVVSTNASYTFTVTSNRTLVANFNNGQITGLVAYYPFNGNANDESGNANNGTDLVGGVSFITGKYGQAAKFGGYSTPGNIRVPNSTSLQFTTGASFVYWVRLDNAAGMDGWGRSSANGNQCVFAKSHDRSGITNNMGYTSQNKLYSGLGSSNGGGVGSKVQGISGYAIGNWIHIAYSCSSTSNTLYVNGVQDSTTNTPLNFSTSNTQDLYFGKYSDYWYPLNGALDEMRIYNRPLNLTEIQQLYNKPTGLFDVNVKLPELSLYPNPTETFLQISSPEILQRIEVCDIAGRLIFTKTINSDKCTLLTDSFVGGIYIVKGFTNQGIITGKFVRE